MKQERYMDKQIAFALRQAESGTAVAEICRERQRAKPYALGARTDSTVAAG